MREIGSSSKSVFWSLFDQGLVSLGNFLTNILLARSLVPGDYGIFALIYGMLLFMNSYHSCAVVYPLSLTGAAGTIEELHHQIRRSICLTVIFAVPLGLIIFGAAIVLHRPNVTVWAVLALFCWQIQETLRRGLMAHLRHAEAIWGDALSYLAQAGAIWLYVKSGHHSLATIFGIMGFTSVLAAAVQIRQLRLVLRLERNLLSHIQRSWKVSRWAVLANTAVVVPGIVYPWLLALRSTDLAGAYQALLNIIGLSNPIMMSVGNVILPATGRAHVRDGIKGAGRMVFRYGVLGGALLAPCYLLIFIWPGVFLKILYGAASPYSLQHDTLRILVVAYSAGYVAYLFAGFFYGLGQSKSVLRAQGMGAVAAVIVGIPLIWQLKVPGASIAIGIVYFVQIFVFLLQKRRLKDNQKLHADHTTTGGSRELTTLRQGQNRPETSVEHNFECIVDKPR